MRENFQIRNPLGLHFTMIQAQESGGRSTKKRFPLGPHPIQRTSHFDKFR